VFVDVVGKSMTKRQCSDAKVGSVSGHFSGEIEEHEKAVTLLNKCDKFWRCVADRDNLGKPKHCYMPKGLKGEPH
jgi:hypothetical protein